MMHMLEKMSIFLSFFYGLLTSYKALLILNKGILLPANKINLYILV